MPKLHSETFGASDYTWLASDHGTNNARTLTLDAAAFQTVQAASGKVPSGYPVALSGDRTVVPFTGTGTFAGHILEDQDARYGNIPVAVLVHGIVKTGLVPLKGFTAPTAQPKSSITYL